MDADRSNVPLDDLSGIGIGLVPKIKDRNLTLDHCATEVLVV